VAAFLFSVNVLLTILSLTLAYLNIQIQTHIHILIQQLKAALFLGTAFKL
jgi:hypothetical protein